MRKLQCVMVFIAVEVQPVELRLVCMMGLAASLCVLI